MPKRDFEDVENLKKKMKIFKKKLKNDSMGRRGRNGRPDGAVGEPERVQKGLETSGNQGKMSSSLIKGLITVIKGVSRRNAKDTDRGTTTII